MRKLATTRSSRILVSTRLYPADLQTETGGMRLGCEGVFLHGLADDDALNLWRAFGVSGSREALLPLFHTFENHPLLIQALAGEVAHDRRTPGNFDGWRKSHPGFDPFRLPLVQVKSHVLEYALRGLDETARKVLHTIAAFRMPAAYDTLVALLVGKRKPCRSENALIAILADLEDRGLLGWDRRANRYDLHPLVRGVTWSGVTSQARQGIYQTLSTHFESLPMIEGKRWREVNSLEDLTAAIELYNTLIGLGRYDDAERLFYERLGDATLYRLSASRQSAELVEMLFPDGLDQLPRLSRPDAQGYVLNTLALSTRDQPGRAAALYRRAIGIYEQENNQEYVSTCLYSLSDELRFSGALRESEVAVCRALLITQQLSDKNQESVSLYYLGLALAARGMKLESAKALDRSLVLALRGTAHIAYDFQAMRAIWFGEYADAQALAKRAMTYVQQQHYERGMIRAARLQGGQH